METVEVESVETGAEETAEAESVEQETSLFGKPVMTDEEMASDDSESTEETASSQPEEKTEGQESEEETGDAEEKDEEQEEREEVKVPPGFVDLKALHAERAKRQGLQRKVEELTQLLNQTPEPKPEEGEEGFKELSDDEFQALVDDDPVNAVLYLKRKGDHERKVMEEAAQSRAKQAEQTKLEMIGESARGLMRAAIPGFFDDDKTVNAELVEFAADNGFTSELMPLTVPETMIMAPGDKEPRPLGDLAAHLVIALNNMRVRYNSVDPKTIEKEVAERVTAELTKKMRTDSQPASFMDSPGGNNSEFKTQKILSPAEVAQLSEKEQEAYLMSG